MATKKRRDEHVVMVSNGVACMHCGAREDFGLPARVEVIAFQAKTFGKLHARCEERPDNKMAKPMSLTEWYASPHCGLSSATIAHVLGHGPLINGFGARTPSDPADFARCHRLLAMFPGWRERLGEVADRFPDWRPLVDHWSELEALYVEEEPTGNAPKLWARMRALQGRG